MRKLNYLGVVSDMNFETTRKIKIQFGSSFYFTAKKQLVMSCRV